jgi:hypothetical protein
VKRLNDRELGQELVAFFGPTTTARLLGWCALTALSRPSDAGEPDREALLRHGWGGTTSRYRNVNHLRAFKEHLTARGLTVEDEPERSALWIVAEAVA